jgi:hypothetical protein
MIMRKPSESVCHNDLDGVANTPLPCAPDAICSGLASALVLVIRQ